MRLGARYRGENDPTVTGEVASLVAHEAAHLWNGQMFENSEERGGDWMHEGGADAFMFRARRDVGVYSLEQYRTELSDALSLCVLGLRGAPLVTSSRAGWFKNYYWCGSTLALWTEAALARAKPTGDLFTFWRELFDRAAHDRRYDAALYFRVLAERAPDTADGMRRFGHVPRGRPLARLVPARDAYSRVTRARG